MSEGGEDKTAFFAGKGVFCYLKIRFGLKNARATYQRLVDKLFYDQIGRNLKAYVDNMVIKSTSKEDMLVNIKEILERFRSINMKLNQKSAFLALKRAYAQGHIKPQWKISSLQPFPIKRSSTPVNEEIYGGLANAHSTDARRGSDNVPHSFDKEHKRSLIRKKGRRAAKRLRRYFQSHMVTILTDFPIKQTLTKPKKSGRVAKRAIELGEHDIVFQKRADDNKKRPKDFLIELQWFRHRTDADRSRRKRVYVCSTIRIRNNEQQSRVRSTIGRVTNSTGDGHYKLGNFRRLLVVSKSNKRNLCSQATNVQRIPIEDKRGLEGLRQLHDQTHSKESK
ncbi:hypothetical protein Tco_0976699 [Tanacetum coccineum]|uniref:Reverse transcriptase domain-containing protein n=1 Tax=Tanacetum coccineum TaxID=301880 RepID=A0ABQ5EIE4_9ASTR